MAVGRPTTKRPNGWYSACVFMVDDTDGAGVHHSDSARYFRGGAARRSRLDLGASPRERLRFV